MTTRTPARRRSSLWWTWFGTVTLAELVGFCVPLVVGAGTVDAAPWVATPALLVAGAVEGAVLGAGQARVLRRAVPELAVGDWVAATAGAAAFCYALGLLPSLAADVWATWSPAVLAVVTGVLGLALLAAMGTAQWWVLRRHVPRAGLWIPATALAWLVGLGAFVAIATPLWAPGQPTVLILVIGVAAAVVMAAAVAAITGWAAVRLLAHRPVAAGRPDGE